MAPTSTLHLDLPIRSRGVRRALLTGISYRDLGARYPEFKLTSTWADVKHLQEFLKSMLAKLAKGVMLTPPGRYSGFQDGGYQGANRRARS